MDNYERNGFLSSHHWINKVTLQRSRGNNENVKWRLWLVRNWVRCASRLYPITLLVQHLRRVHHETSTWWFPRTNVNRRTHSHQISGMPMTPLESLDPVPNFKILFSEWKLPAKGMASISMCRRRKLWFVAKMEMTSIWRWAMIIISSVQTN